LDISEAGEYYWDNTEFPRYLAYYKNVPEVKSAIDAMAMWVTGKGWTADPYTENILNNIVGWGEDSFQSIMRAHEVMTMLNGDAYAEIVRNDSGVLINLKPLDPRQCRTVVNSKGFIVRYEVREGGKMRKIPTTKMLHSTENRLGAEYHGTGKLVSVTWLLDAKKEAMKDLRRVMHRSTIRVLYIDMDEEDTLTKAKTQYKDAIKNGEVLIMPARKGEAEFEDLSVPPVTVYLEWIKYVGSEIYKAVGTPEIILGGSQEYTEAGSKVGYMTFEQPYMTRQKLLETDLWNQVGVKVKFERPTSIKDDVQKGEAQNTGQTNFQQGETQLNTKGRE